MTDSNSLRFSSCVLILFSCIAGFLYCALNPIWNWDVLGYAASVESLTESDVNVIHANVYTALKDSVSEHVWVELTESTQYRKVMHDDAEAFAQQIPFYKIRILFVLLMFAMTKLGIEILNTAHLLSAAFFSLGTLIYYLSLRKFAHSYLWLLLPAMLYTFTHELQISQQGLVDSFSYFWMALVAYAFVNNRSWLYLLIAMLVLVRTDLIMLTALIFGFSWFIAPGHRKRIVLWGMVTATLYLAINKWAGNYGWHALFYFVFVTDMSASHPENYSNYQVTAAEYLKHLITPRWAGTPIYLAYLLFCVNACLFACLASHKQKNPKALKKIHDRRETQFRVFLLSCISGSYIVAHYLLFPLFDSRFFIGCYVAIGAGFLILSNEVLSLRSEKTSSAPNKRLFSIY